jgi:hypothetical protein
VFRPGGNEGAVTIRKNPVFNRIGFLLPRERRGILGARKSGAKRPVYVNGECCESMTVAAVKATQISGTEVKLWQIYRAVNGGLKIKGVDISEKPLVMRKPVVEAKRSGGPLLRYPFGERPLDRGLLGWR